MAAESLRRDGRTLVSAVAAALVSGRSSADAAALRSHVPVWGRAGMMGRGPPSTGRSVLRIRRYGPDRTHAAANVIGAGRPDHPSCLITTRSRCHDGRSLRPPATSRRRSRSCAWWPAGPSHVEEAAGPPGRQYGPDVGGRSCASSPCGEAGSRDDARCRICRDANVAATAVCSAPPGSLPIGRLPDCICISRGTHREGLKARQRASPAWATPWSLNGSGPPLARRWANPSAAAPRRPGNPVGSIAGPPWIRALAD